NQRVTTPHADGATADVRAIVVEGAVLHPQGSRAIKDPTAMDRLQGREVRTGDVHTARRQKEEESPAIGRRVLRFVEDAFLEEDRIARGWWVARHIDVPTVSQVGQLSPENAILEPTAPCEERI